MHPRIKNAKLWLSASLIAATLTLGTSVRAESKGGSHLFVDFGVYGTNLKERFTAPSGMASELSSLTGFARLRPALHVGKNYYFEPSFGTALPWRSGADGTTKAFTSHFELKLSKEWYQKFRIRVGPGLYWGYYLSNGDTVSLGNGASTSNFYTASGSTHVFLVTADLGLSFRVFKRLNLNFDFFVLQPYSQARRRFNAAITLGLRL